MFDSSLFDLSPKADPRAVVKGEHYRFTVLTERLIRMEYSPDGVFEDRPTKVAFHRAFPVPEFRVIESENSLEILTAKLHLYYDKQKFSLGGLSIRVEGMQKHKCAKWHYHMEAIKIHTNYINLKGTTSTLDSIDGETELEDGLLDRHGFTVLDDTNTMVLDENGWFQPLDRPGSDDLYFFGYLQEHRDCIRDFYRLSGKTPMIPRYALGNWWSRYYSYTDKTYTDLMNEFEAHRVPLSVAVLDMGWHICDPDPKYGNGWTGYTWDRRLFPDPKAFLKSLHDRDLKVTLNLHPHDGVRAYETNYENFARRMGVNAENGDTVQFDASDPKHMKAYLEEILHPLEDEGVDFWWLDWQQRGGTSRDGYDPLYMLNHYFYLDSARRGDYPMTFSRFAGIGSQRYPIGFSGDTVMTWDSLNFQPYFTNCASNVGYGWWSHDIGGHTRGIWSNELQIRWLQYGVFSPINRLHSANNEFLLKEPWNFPAETETIMEDFLRLRHKLIPYLYTMNYRNAHDLEPLISPLYYEYPEKMTNDFTYRNQYLFGTSLMVCPITSPGDPTSLTGKVNAWIPSGTWIDFFTHRIYRGEKSLSLYRTKESIPVLAKAGAIVPLDAEAKNGAALPEKLHLKVFCGADGDFELYEDNGKLKNCRFAKTPLSFRWGTEACFTVGAVQGDAALIPAGRQMEAEFVAAEAPQSVALFVGGKERECNWHYEEKTRSLFVSLGAILPQEEAVVSFTTTGALAEADKKAELVAVLTRAQAGNVWKASIYEAIKRGNSPLSLAAEIARLTENASLLGEMMEILTSSEK